MEIGPVKTKIDHLISESISRIDKWSIEKKILLMILIWLILFLPSIIHHSVVQKDEHIHFFPEEAAPPDFVEPDWNVTTAPQPLDNTSERGEIQLNVSSGETIEFKWIWNHGTDVHTHIGTVNVFYKIDGGKEKKIRLTAGNSTDKREIWTCEKTFEREGVISYHYRVERTDLSRYNRRASIILEGKNPYEEARTGPPPLIHFFFIPPVILSAPIGLGGYFLSFNLYFALFLLLDSLLLFKCLSFVYEKKAYFFSLLFIANPLTVLTLHQDECIVVFLTLLPLYFLMKNKKFLSGSVGVGMIAKVWTSFWIPVLLLLNDEDIKNRLAHLTAAIMSAAGLLLFFRLIWGPDVLWFLSFYGGSAGRSSIGGISFWNIGGKLFGLSGISSSILFILIGVGLLEVMVIFTSWKKDMPDIPLLTALMAVFFAFYPKIHWEYYLIIFPPLIFLGLRESKYISVLYLVSIFAVLSRTFKDASPPTIYLSLSFFFSICISLILIWSVYQLFEDVRKREESEI